MNVNYRFYEPNKGLEEFQAKIFNQANNRAVTAKEIRKRYEEEKIDPKTVRYAFSNDNKPLAYVQARARLSSFWRNSYRVSMGYA